MPLVTLISTTDTHQVTLISTTDTQTYPSPPLQLVNTTLTSLSIDIPMDYIPMELQELLVQSHLPTLCGNMTHACLHRRRTAMSRIGTVSEAGERALASLRNASQGNE